MNKALADIVILSCEQFEAGPACTELLAFLGAEVIMVEPPGRGQPGRWTVPEPGGLKPGVDSYYHIYMNLNKKSITLNLRDEKGVKIFKEMAKKVDVVFDNQGPHTMERLGLHYDVLKEINPKLIVATVKGFGSGGPYSDYFAFDFMAQALGGAYSLTGYAENPPVLPGPTVGDTGAGVHCFGAILAALYQRERTGKGQFVEVAMADSVLNFNRIPLATRHAPRDPMYQSGIGAKRTGNTTAEAAPFNIYKTKDSEEKDNYVVIVTSGQHQWEALLKVIGREDLIGDERFKDNAARFKYVEMVDRMVEEWTIKQTAYEAFHALARAGVPASITLNTAQVMNDPHFVSRGTVVEIDHPVRGRIKTIACVPKLSDSPVEVKPAPLVGEHNAEIYGKLMGYGPKDLVRLKGQGIIS